MRRFPVLLVAAVAACSPAPLASAHGSAPSEAAPAGCLPPNVVQEYDDERFSVSVTLPATGCPARENRQFSMSVWLTRTDDKFSEGHGQVVVCGPFPSAADSGESTQVRAYACDVEGAVLHPSPEAAHYDVDVSYPGADGEETMTLESFCTTDDHGTYSCTSQSAAV